MEVTLIVVGGKNAGKEVPVAGPKFFIGRAADCQLKPHSDLVSRHHCAIMVEEAFVAIRDFGSKNGTQVNGERVQGERELKVGDRITVGDLELEVQFGVGIGGKKKPKVKSVQEAVARTVEASGDDDMDLDSWLSDTDTQTLDPADTESAASEADSETTPDGAPRRKKKKTDKIPGTWKKNKTTAVAPSDAAANTLKNFFRNPGH
jgi:pSer/pThr/pTyr-binding forkhead associated (FHA) protein